MTRASAIGSALGIGVLLVGLLSAGSGLSETSATSGGEVVLAAPVTDFARVTDADGDVLSIRAVDDDSPDERAAVGLTAAGAPVIVRTLYTRAGEMLAASLSAAATPDAISLAWADPFPYDVLRDGRIVASAVSGSFAEAGLPPDSGYVYTLRPSAAADAPEQILQVRTLPDDADAIIARVSDPVTALSPRVPAVSFVYNTFLTADHVDWDVIQGILGGCQGTFGDRFNGDGRDFTTPVSPTDPWAGISHRTGVHVGIDFGSGEVTEERSVSPSLLYDAAGRVKADRTAPADGIVFSERHVGSDSYSVRITHEVGNPLCPVGAVRYTLDLQLWDSGALRLEGVRHPVPAHEAYVLFADDAGDGAWQPVYRGAQGSLACVSGLCPTESIASSPAVQG